MVGEDCGCVWESEEIVSPFVKGAYDSQEFSIVDLIVPFYWRKGLRDVAAWVQVSI